MKILFVCLGNICRSPMAEAIFNHKAQHQGMLADSAGTAAYHIGERPDSRTLQVLSNAGIDTPHTAQQVTRDDFNRFNYIVAMDNSNLQDLKSIAGSQQEKLLLMRDFDGEKKGADVPDPYYGGLSDFEHVYEVLDRSIDAFMMFLEKEK